MFLEMLLAPQCHSRNESAWRPVGLGPLSQREPSLRASYLNLLPLLNSLFIASLMKLDIDSRFPTSGSLGRCHNFPQTLNTTPQRAKSVNLNAVIFYSASDPYDPKYQRLQLFPINSSISTTGPLYRQPLGALAWLLCLTYLGIPP